MNLEELYQQICNNIKKIKFDLIWKDFAPTKFALVGPKATPGSAGGIKEL